MADFNGVPHECLTAELPILLLDPLNKLLLPKHHGEVFGGKHHKTTSITSSERWAAIAQRGTSPPVVQSPRSFGSLVVRRPKVLLAPRWVFAVGVLNVGPKDEKLMSTTIFPTCSAILTRSKGKAEPACHGVTTSVKMDVARTWQYEGKKGRKVKKT